MAREPKNALRAACVSVVVTALLAAPLFAHLGLVAVAGLYLPAPLVAWFQHVARLLG